MKKIILFLTLGCSLFAAKPSPAPTIQMAPYVYGDLFQPGYGVSFRAQEAGHSFELAPLFVPPSRGHFGSSQKRMGLTASYSYLFLRSWFVQPYLGVSYTHIRDVHRTLTRGYDGQNSGPYKVIKSPVERENFVSSLIGIQFCSPSGDFPGTIFVDVLGPLTFDEYGMREKVFLYPRIGAGFRF